MVLCSQKAQLIAIDALPMRQDVSEVEAGGIITDRPIAALCGNAAGVILSFITPTPHENPVTQNSRAFLQ
jgi:hypothetical protein